MQFNNYGVKGADVSFHQDDNNTPQRIDFTKMKEQGASFVFIRGGQNLWVDPDFEYNWKAAKSAGLPRGVYWFYDSRANPEAQADKLYSVIKDDLPEIGIVLDLEENYGGAYPGYKNWKLFLNKIKTLAPSAEIIIYSSLGYISGKMPLAEYPYFAKFPLWLAYYTDNPNNAVVPLPWTSALFWQWGTPPWGKQWGCESIEIDMNLFNGTQEEFNKRYGLQTMPGNQDGGSMIYQGTIITTSLNIRPQPNTSLAPYYTKPMGTKLEADSVQSGWWHITKINGVAVTQESWAYEGLNKGYIRTDAIIDNAPTTLPPIHIHHEMTYNAPGYPDKTIIINEDWNPL